MMLPEIIPPGFEPWVPASPFMQGLTAMGPLYVSGPVIALRVTEAHTNMHAIAHGGMLASLADCALGHALTQISGRPSVTVQMSIEYLRAVQPGQWLQARVQVEKQGRSLAHASCLLQVGDNIYVKANAVFAFR